MKNRIALCNAIGMALVTLAVVCGICAIGCLGPVEWGDATIIGGLIRSVLFGIGAVVMGLVGFAFAVV